MRTVVASLLDTVPNLRGAKESTAESKHVHIGTLKRNSSSLRAHRSQLVGKVLATGGRRVEITFNQHPEALYSAKSIANRKHNKQRRYSVPFVRSPLVLTRRTTRSRCFLFIDEVIRETPS